MKRSLITLILGLSFATSWALAQERSETSDADVTKTVKQSEEASETLAPPSRDDQDLAAGTEAEENKYRERRRARSLNWLFRAAQRNPQDDYENLHFGERKANEREGDGENAARRDIEAEVNEAISEMEEFRQGLLRDSHDQVRAFENEMRELEAARAKAELVFRRRQLEFQKRMQEIQRAHAVAEAAAKDRERAVHAKMLALQHKLNSRRDSPHAERDHHRHDADRPHHTRDPQASIHSELQDAVRQLRAEIAELREEVAELTKRVDER